jgi:hypothetical protein
VENGPGMNLYPQIEVEGDFDDAIAAAGFGEAGRV